MTKRLGIRLFEMLHRELFWAYEAKLLDMDTNLQTSINKPMTLWHVREGWASIQFQGRKLQAKSGDWVICPKGTLTQEFEKGTLLLSIAFSMEWPGGQKLVDGGLPCVISGQSLPGLEAAAVQLIAEIESKSPNYFRRGVHRGVDVMHFLRELSLVECARIHALHTTFTMEFFSLLEALKLPLKIPGAKDPRALELWMILSASELSTPPDTRLLSRRLGLTWRRLEQIFQKDFNMSPLQLWEDRRAQYARRNLANREIPMKRVSYDLGFSAPTAFSKWFRRIHQCTPSEFRSGFHG
jgi:AraC-like DNA-binding protein